MNSKYIVDQIIKSIAIRFVEENIKRSICDLAVRQRFIRLGTKSTSHKRTSWQTELYQNVKPLLLLRIS